MSLLGDLRRLHHQQDSETRLLLREEAVWNLHGFGVAPRTLLDGLGPVDGMVWNILHARLLNVASELPN